MIRRLHRALLQNRRARHAIPSHHLAPRRRRRHSNHRIHSADRRRVRRVAQVRALALAEIRDARIAARRAGGELGQVFVVGGVLQGGPGGDDGGCIAATAAAAVGGRGGRGWGAGGVARERGAADHTALVGGLHGAPAERAGVTRVGAAEGAVDNVARGHGNVGELGCAGRCCKGRLVVSIDSFL